jgi:hypothetical protein
MATPTEILVEVARVFEGLEIPYVVVGSLASSARGVRRATVDADIVARVQLKHVPDLVNILSSLNYYIDGLAARRAIESERAFNAIHLDSAFKVDVYTARDDFSILEIERRMPENILPNSDTVVYIATAEDTVVAKLVWFGKGGKVSDRQWSDVLGILKVQKGVLDYDHITRWCEQLGVRDLLDKAMAEA